MVVTYEGNRPEVHSQAFVAPDAVLVGQVRLASQSSVWFQAVLRADNDVISIGARSNLQEHVVAHVDAGYPISVGEDCVIGHRAVLHGCTLGNRVLIGIGAIVLNGAIIEDDVLVGAGALVTEGSRLEAGYLYLGSPARKVRPLNPEDRQRILRGAQGYVQKGESYRHSLESKPHETL